MACSLTFKVLQSREIGNNLKNQVTWVQFKMIVSENNSSKKSEKISKKSRLLKNNVMKCNLVF